MSKWASTEALAVRWRETKDNRLLEGLIRELVTFAERKIWASLTSKGLHDHLDILGQEIRSAALLAAWRALQTWKPELSSLAHWASFYASSFAGRLATKVRRLDLVSLFEPVGAVQNEEDDLTLEDILPSDAPLPEEIMTWRAVQEALSALPGKHQEVLRRRLRGETLNEIGKALGLTLERVRQLEAEALARLRRRFRA